VHFSARVMLLVCRTIISPVTDVDFSFKEEFIYEEEKVYNTLHKGFRKRPKLALYDVCTLNSVRISEDRWYSISINDDNEKKMNK